MIVKRSKFLKANGPTSRLSGECGGDDRCTRPVWREGLCASHFKRKQRGKPIGGPIGDSVMPGGLELGEVPSAEELLLKAAGDYIECDSEDDELFERCRRTVFRAGIRLAESKGYVKVKDALDLAQSLGWQPPLKHSDRARRHQPHRRRRASVTQLELPFREFFHEPNWADEARLAK
jgi:hypothetical protein